MHGVLETKSFLDPIDNTLHSSVGNLAGTEPFATITHWSDSIFKVARKFRLPIVLKVISTIGGLFTSLLHLGLPLVNTSSVSIFLKNTQQRRTLQAEGGPTAQSR